MDKKLQLWEILKGLTEGAYICGDTFINQIGEIIYIDINHNLVMNNELINTLNEWEYVDNE